MYQKMKGKYGITLVSLVITVIVLLILAGVAISLAVDSNGLFGKAGEAANKWNASIAEESQIVENLLNYMNEVTGGNQSGGGDDDPVGSYITETSTIAGVEKERTAPIPKEYTASQVEGENTIAGGLVIYQTETAVTAENHDTALTDYNQYVWIPVDDINDMIMCKRNGTATKIDGTATAEGNTICNLTLQGNELECSTHGYSTADELTTANINTTGLAGRLYGVDSTYTTVDGNNICQTDMTFTTNTQTFTVDSGYREPDVLTDETNADGNTEYLTAIGIKAEKEGETVIKTAIEVFKAQLNADYIEMAKSVAKYGGFYVSRYEVGENGASKKNQKVLTASASSSGNYLKGDSWYGLYNTLRNKTGVNTGVVKSQMIWRKPVRPNDKIFG